MAYPAGFETRSDSAVGGTINDVATTDPITASNHNILQSAIYELEKKLGLATIAKADTAGHFAMPHTTDGGPPTGNPDNGEGSMVWDSANNKLYVATADSATWATIGGSAFTEAVTITVNSASDALTLTNPGGNALKVAAASVSILEIIDTGSYASPSITFQPDPDVGGFLIAPSKKPTSGADNLYSMFEVRDGSASSKNFLKCQAQHAGANLIQIGDSGAFVSHMGTLNMYNMLAMRFANGNDSCTLKPGNAYSGTSAGAIWQVGNNGSQGGMRIDGQGALPMQTWYGNDDATDIGKRLIHFEYHVPFTSEDVNPLNDDLLGQLQGVQFATATITKDSVTGTFITIPAGSIIRKVYFRVATAFDGTFSLDVGNGTDADGFLETADITEGLVGIYGIDEQDRGLLLWDLTNAIGEYSISAQTVVATIAAGGATVGTGVLYVEYERIH